MIGILEGLVVFGEQRILEVGSHVKQEFAELGKAGVKLLQLLVGQGLSLEVFGVEEAQPRLAHLKLQEMVPAMQRTAKQR